MHPVLTLIGAGAALGVVAALVFTKLAQNLLFGVAADDPATLTGVVLLMGTAALMAGYLPAHRATRIDPMAALRCE